MRLLLAVTLVLLFLWLHKANNDDLHGGACEALSMSGAAVSLLLSPLSFYSWLTSTLVRLILSVPALVLQSLGHSVLLLVAWPCCVVSVCFSLLMTCLHVALYVLHLGLAVGVVVILTLTQHGVSEEKGQHQRKTVKKHNTTSEVKVFGYRAVQQG